MKRKLNKITKNWTIKDEANQYAYDRSNDWMIETPTWNIVREAFEDGYKLGKFNNTLYVCSKK